MQAQPSHPPADHTPLEVLQAIAADLQDDRCLGQALEDTLQQYIDLLEGLGVVDLTSEQATENLELKNGQALATAYAARCIEDWMRTKIFIRGILQAIKTVQAKQAGPVNIFYAGTGPFAALLLPIMAILKPSDIQCTLLEINQLSFTTVKRTIKTLGLESYVTNYIRDDATKFVFPKDQKVDILLSETMSEALITEPQVPILINLVPQLKKDTIIIPQQIEVQVALMKNLPYQNRKSDTPFSSYCLPIDTILNINAERVRELATSLSSQPEVNPFEITNRRLECATMTPYSTLMALTEIQVFENEWLRFTDCILTCPIPLQQLDEEITTDKTLTIQYTIENTPKFIMDLKNIPSEIELAKS